MGVEPRVLAGRYRVGDLIGEGGMAKVFRGYDLTLGRDVAIKILDPALARDATFRNRFRMEAQAASRMSHPSIVRVFDAGEPNPASPETASDEPFIVMELVQGTLLKTIMAEGPVSTTDAVRYVDGILEALEYSHRAGVIHRDIKPGNVMVTDSGQVKVMDFGIARAISDSSATVAETTQILGTAAYFSPEQAKGEPVDARTDLYSVGVVLYELLAGRQPFRGDSPVAVAYQHVSETPASPTEVNAAAPANLNPIVLRALAKDPYQRFADAASFRTELAAAVNGKTPTKRQLALLTNELYGDSPRHAEETARALHQLSTDNTMTRTQPGPPVVWVWAGVLLLAVLLSSVVFWVVSFPRPEAAPSNSRTISNVSEWAAGAAQAELERIDLVVTTVTEPSAEVAEGNVIRTNPSMGTSVKVGQEIVLYISSGIETVPVPALLGLPLGQVQSALQGAGLQLGSILEENDPANPADIVLSAATEDGIAVVADSQVPPGTVINVTVSSGVVGLGDYRGWTMDAATEALTKLGLTPVPVEVVECPATNPPTVNSLSAAPGDVPVQSAIELRHCVGE